MKFIYQDNVFGLALKEIKKAIQGSKWENHVFLVGGAVRDAILGQPLKDIDLCVDMPNGGIEFAKWICNEYGCMVNDSNPCVFTKYGTAKFNLRTIHELSKVDIECVQTRKEQYHADSRNPETVFGTISEDCLRRDLTINALYVNLSTDEVLDPCGKGINDINKHIIRTPTDANIVFEDDPLRMLRAIRFSTRYNWGITADTWVGIVKNTYRIGIISAERISDELSKILLCTKPSIGIIKLVDCGLMQRIIPEIYQLKGIKQGVQHYGDVFEHTMSVIDNTQPIIEHRWAGLLHDIGKIKCKSIINGVIHFYGHDSVGAGMSNDILAKLKFPNKEIRAITIAVAQHMRFKNIGQSMPSLKSIRKFVMQVEGEFIPIILDVMNADNISHSKEYCNSKQVPYIIDKINEIQNDKNNPPVKLPITGTDIMNEFNLKSGPTIGILLDKLNDFYAENPNLTKDDYLEYLSQFI